MTAMPGRFTSPRFVGRESEFARLAAALDEVAAGRPTTLLVTADAGLGATRFLDEAIARIGRLSQPYTVLPCRTATSLDARPYGPVLAGLRPLLRSIPDPDLGPIVGPNGAELQRLLPELGPRLSALDLLPRRVLVSDPERRQSRLLEGVLGVLIRLGERRPVVVVIEDLHRVDPATRSLTEFIARVSRAQRVGLIATYQPDALTRDHPLGGTLVALAESARPPATVALGPLALPEVAELIAGVEGERPTASTLLLVHERSGGSPLVAEELLAARRELTGASLTVPLAGLVTARVANRSPECRRVLRLLAPAGRPMSRSELADVAAAFESGLLRRPPRSSTGPRQRDGALDPDLAAGLAEAIDHGFVVERPVDAGSARPAPVRSAAAGEPLLDIRHELIARAIVADLLPRQRPRHYAALAAAAADRPTVAAWEWLRAHQPAAARAAALAAAAEAEAVDAPDVALEYLGLALELTDAAAATERPVTRAASRASAADVEGVRGLLGRAAEAANAAGDPARAAAYAEAAVAGLDERTDRLELGLRLERLGRFRWGAGDHDGAVAELRRAIRLVPVDAPLERARVLAALAQIRMLDGVFSESIGLARDAIEVARSAGEAGRGEMAHALTTLGVAEGWGDDPEAGFAHLRQARALAESAGRLDGVFRAYANLTTLLDLHGRREEAVEVAMDGIAAARLVGQEAVYGNFLRGNAADSLFYLGRWDEARALAAVSLEWGAAGVGGYANSAMNLAMVEVEARAGELAGRLLGRLLLRVETVPDPQYAPPVYQAAASFALWRDDLVDARRASEHGWARVRGTEDWALIARMAATVLEVCAETVAAAQEGRDLAGLAFAREQADRVLAEAEATVAAAGVDVAHGSRREADARLATARAYRDRLDGRDHPATWASVAAAWSTLGDRYQVAKARWRQAEAILAAADGRAERGAARRPLVESASIAVELGAIPLLRAIHELAGRALIRFPEALGATIEERLAVREAGRAGRRDAVAIPVGAPPPDTAVLAALEPVSVAAAARPPGGALSPVARELVGESPARRDTFGLSPREREVLALIALGRTNREIGDRLFISQKTVGVHVGNILAKLGVSGRVEAAAVAIRLGLTERR